LPPNKSTTYDLKVNHEVVFKCGKHNVVLDGEPTWFHDDDGRWLVDVGDMYCSGLDKELEQQNFPDTEEGGKAFDAWSDNNDCTESWTTTVIGLHVSPNATS